MRRAIVLLVVMVVTAGCGTTGSDTGTPGTSTTTEPATTTTSTPTSTQATPAPPPEDFSLGDPITIDARDVIGTLSAPEGWRAWIDESGTLLIADGETVCGEEGESCAAGWVAIESYVGADVPGLTRYLDEADATSDRAEEGVVGALRRLVDDYYAWIAVQDWETYDFEPIDPAPAQVGTLRGLHFGYRGARGDESIQHTDAYAAFDGTYLYVVMVRMPELVPTPEPVDFVADFAPSLAAIVTDLRLPIPAGLGVPELTSDWRLEPDDFLVSAWTGIVVVRGDPGSGTVAHVISTEPTSQAHHDRMNGIVFQQALPRSGHGTVHPSEMAVWWVSEPGAVPIALHEPNPGRSASLFGVAELEGTPHALYMVVETGRLKSEYVLVAHDLVSGEPGRVGPIGGGEVWPDCVSWAIDRFVVSRTAEENSFFDFVSIDGTVLEPETPVPPALEPNVGDGTWYASTCAALRESDGSAAVVLRTFEGPNRLVIVDVARGTEVQTIEIDAEALAAGAEMEMFPGDIGFWETRVEFVGSRVLVTDLGYGVSNPFIVDLDTGEITMLPVEGMATLVR